MGLFDKLRKPKMIKSRVYGEFPEFVSEEKLPDDLQTLNTMGRYYMRPYDGNQPDYTKAFLINSKLLRLDTGKQYMEARCRQGDLYAEGKGTARDLNKGNTLRNEWYAHMILHDDSIYDLGLQLTACLERHCMNWKEMMELACQRLKLDWDNYASPTGAALLELLKLFWKDRDVQAAEGLTNQQYTKYLYDTYQEPNALYLLAGFEADSQKRDAMLYQAADAGCVFATARITGLTLAYAREEAEMKRLLEYRNLENQQMQALQEKAGAYMRMEPEEILK